MPVEYAGIAITSVGVIVCIALHAYAHRFTKLGFFGILAVSFLGGALVVVLGHLVLLRFTDIPVVTHAAFLIGDLGLYCCGWYVFQNVMGGNESSIRFRILEEISLAGGSIPERLLRERYNDVSLIKVRLQKLMDGGQVLESQGHYRLASQNLALLSSIFWFLKRAILRTDSEFDSASQGRHS